MANNSQVAHVWANQTKESMRGSNFYFHGANLYSYGSHFIVGTIVTNKQGERAALLNSRTYSNSTASHQSYAWRAVSGLMPYWQVPNLTGNTETDKALYLESIVPQIKELVAKAKRATIYGASYLSEAAELLTSAHEFAGFFGIRKKFPTLEKLGVTDELLAQCEEKERTADERRNKRRETMRRREHERQAEQRRQDAEQFAQWRNGEKVSCPWSYSQDEDGSAYLRTTADHSGSAIVQTSKGAEVPFSHAVRAFKFVKLCKMAGSTFQANGHSVRVGHFSLTSIDAEGNVRIGCHFISWRRIEEWAKQGQIINEHATDEALEVTQHH